MLISLKMIKKKKYIKFSSTNTFSFETLVSFLVSVKIEHHKVITLISTK